MTRERLHELLDLVLDCRRFEHVVVTIEIDAYHEIIYVWEKNQEEGINMVVYTSSEVFPPKGETKYNGVRHVGDPGLVKAEAHIRRLLAEKEEEGNDTV